MFKQKIETFPNFEIKEYKEYYNNELIIHDSFTETGNITNRNFSTKNFYISNEMFYKKYKNTEFFSEHHYFNDKTICFLFTKNYLLIKHVNEKWLYIYGDYLKIINKKLLTPSSLPYTLFYKKLIHDSKGRPIYYEDYLGNYIRIKYKNNQWFLIDSNFNNEKLKTIAYKTLQITC